MRVCKSVALLAPSACGSPFVHTSSSQRDFYTPTLLLQSADWELQLRIGVLLHSCVSVCLRLQQRRTAAEVRALI